MSSTSSIGKRTAVNLFFGIFIQAMIALAFDSGGIISGTIANTTMEIQMIKWILLLYGPLLAARGDIAVLAGKLGTGLHLGTVKPTFRKNTPVYRSLIASTLTIAMLDAFLVGIVTYVLQLITFPAELKVYNPTLFFVILFIIVFAIVALTAKFYIGTLMAISKLISWPIFALIVAGFCILQAFLVLVVGVSITGYF